MFGRSGTVHERIELGMKRSVDELVRNVRGGE